MIRVTALLALVAAPGWLAAQAVTPPHGGAPIYTHPAKDIVAMFEKLCVQGTTDATQQERQARDLGFAPVAQPRSRIDMHWRSISFSTRETQEQHRCDVSGLTDRKVSVVEVEGLAGALRPGQSQDIAIRVSQQGANTTGISLTLVTSSAAAL